MIFKLGTSVFYTVKYIATHCCPGRGRDFPANILREKVGGVGAALRIRTDPHSFWSAGSGCALGILIRIQEAQNDLQKLRKFMFLNARYSLFEG
jgi:hypothetical protein